MPDSTPRKSEEAVPRRQRRKARAEEGEAGPPVAEEHVVAVAVRDGGEDIETAAKRLSSDDATIGERVRWLLDVREFGMKSREGSYGSLRLDREARLPPGYTTRLVHNEWQRIEVRFLARIAKALSSNLEWLATGQGPWQRLAIYDEAGVGEARAEAARFARLSEFREEAIQAVLATVRVNSAPLRAVAYLDMIRGRHQELLAAEAAEVQISPPPKRDTPSE